MIEPKSSLSNEPKSNKKESQSERNKEKEKEKESEGATYKERDSIRHTPHRGASVSRSAVAIQPSFNSHLGSFAQTELFTSHSHRMSSTPPSSSSSATTPTLESQSPSAPSLSSPHHVRRSYFPNPSMDHFVSGLTAGMVATLLLHPFDLIKTRLQVAGFQLPTTDTNRNNHIPNAAQTTVTPSAGTPVRPIVASNGAISGASHSGRIYRSSLHAARSLLKYEGAIALYKGLTPNIVGNTSAWGLYFFGYDVVKRWFSSREPFSLVRILSQTHDFPNGRTQRPLNALEHILAASITGTCVSALTNPLWVVKTRMFLDLTPALTAEDMKKLRPEELAKFEQRINTAQRIPYKGLTDALFTIYRREGIAGLYRGFVPSLFGVSHGAVQFMCYEELKKSRLTYKRRHQSSSLDTQLVQWSTPETIAMSVASKSFATFATYPYQVIRSRMQSAQTNVPVRSVIMSTWRSEGIAGFYRGLWVNLVKVMPAACTVFVVYERMSGYMKRNATYVQQS